MAAPVSRDQELDLRIESLAYGGNGVARLNGFVVFVKRGLPGDTVRARVTKVKRSHAEAVALEVVEAGAPRVPAPCAHYPACGGCRFQDLAYEAQLAAKARQVADALARIGGLADVMLEEAVPAESLFGYRNKLEYSFTTLEDGTLGLGFHRAGRWDEVLDVERCWLTTDLGNAIREAVKGWARAEGLPAYDQERQGGYLRHLVVREGRNTRQALAVLVTAPGDLVGADALVEALRRFPEVRSVHWAVNDSPAEVTNLPTDLLWGEEAIEEEILGLRFRVRPNAFMQTNTAMCEVLYGLAAEYAELTGEETVYDLYCGTGTIGLALARSALTVWGIDFSEESIACAVENAQLNGLPNAAFFAGDVARDLDELVARAGPPDIIVVDPPRAGLSGKAVRRVGELGTPRLVYVSCNPTTLAGNAKELVSDHGYTLERARPVDMFPHTPHVETVALFTRSG
ncbi:MAG TPA: 23S rRNA (uracil(1939)-C(5))-methyltransferase RlmD [Gaiellaceae bacterium]|nr:23S rRNA (uracil(1939)-C(5))-methyltransferase RlmD [Gaiellaceae bacterium]